MNVLVIGGSRGIGKAIARAVYEDGNNVLITGRKQETIDETVNEIAGKREGTNGQKKADNIIQGLAADATNPLDVDRLYDYAAQSFVPDVIVYSAARFPNQATKTSVILPETVELSAILDANVVAPYRLIRQFIPILKERKDPRIVLIGSTSGVREDKGGVYGITKWALRSYATNLRNECKELGIGVSLINPGGTFTETRKKEGENDRHLAESSDFGILVAALLKMSPQAVLERVDLRPLVGDTY